MNTATKGTRSIVVGIAEVVPGDLFKGHMVVWVNRKPDGRIEVHTTAGHFFFRRLDTQLRVRRNH